MTKFVPKEVLGDSTFVSVYDPESGDTGYVRMGDLVSESETTVTATTSPGGGVVFDPAVEAAIAELGSGGAPGSFNFVAQADAPMFKKADTTLVPIQLVKPTSVFDARDYGALVASGDNSAALVAVFSAAADAQAAGVAAAAVLIDENYTFSTPISVPVNVPNIVGGGVLTFNGGFGAPAITLGSPSGSFSKRSISLRVRRSGSRPWTGENDVGVRMYNSSSSEIKIDQTFGFRVGVQLIGDGAGFAYNRVITGELIDHNVGIQLKSVGSGWVNENKFFPKRFGSSSTTNTALVKIGVLFTADGSPINHNIFYSPSFELNYSNSGTDKTYCAASEGDGGVSDNCIYDARVENTEYTFDYKSPSVYPNIFEVGYSGSTPLKQSSVSAKNYSYSKRSSELTHGERIYKSGALKGLLVDEGAGVSSVSGLYKVASSGAIAATFANLSVGAYGIVVASASAGIGVLVDCSVAKRFEIVPSLASGTYRAYVAVYDAAGGLITATGSVSTTSALALSGSVFMPVVSSIDPTTILLSADAKQVFIGIRAHTTPLEMTAFDVYALPYNGVNRPAAPLLVPAI